MQKVLVLGGTQFVGRVFLEELEKTYPNANVTLFNRGKTNTDLFPNYKKVKGDRYTDDILKITHENWDVIVDFSCYHPKSLERLLPLLVGKVDRYIFISTVAVYNFEKAYEKGGIIDEPYELEKYTSEMSEGPLFQHYGNKKAECERILLSYENLDAIILRPSIIFGRYNIYERIYYWMYRIKNHSEAILPEQAGTSRCDTFVDDFAQMILRGMTIKNHRKVYNANSFPPTPLVDILNEVKSIHENKINFIDIPRAYVTDDNKQLTDKIPLFFLDNNRQFSNQKILDDFGIRFHSIKEAFQKTKEYYESINQNNEGNYGLRVNKEKAILFGYFLDKDLYDDTKKLLAEHCEYDIGNEILKGPDAICHSYESNMIAGKKKMDKLEWGQSRIEEINEQEFYVHFTDYLTHQNCNYTHRCKQKLTFGTHHKIIKIQHIHDEDEQNRLNAFYQSVGIKTQ